MANEHTAEPVRDYYAFAVEYFTDKPELMAMAWNAPSLHTYGHLFAPVTKSRDCCFIRPRIKYPAHGGPATEDFIYTREGALNKPDPIIPAGNPFQIANLSAKAETRELTRTIREDKRLLISDDPEYLAFFPEALTILAEWQRIIDARLERATPTLPTFQES